jgi:hypothetical protein
MRVHHVLLFAALSATVALPARAQVSVYYHTGAWDAFDGPGDNGQPVCGIGNRNPADGTSFSLRFQIGGNDVTFTAAKTGWTIPDGTTIPVVMQIGLEQPWTEQATGNGDRLRWTLDRVNAQIFDDQFRRATSMTITYPSGSERPWLISLAGSTEASNAMGRCVTDLTRRAASQPITAPAPVAPNAATQPFGAAPTSAQGTGAPAQPEASPTQPETQQPPTNPAPNPAPTPVH